MFGTAKMKALATKNVCGIGYIGLILYDIKWSVKNEEYNALLLINDCIT